MRKRLLLVAACAVWIVTQSTMLTFGAEKKARLSTEHRTLTAQILRNHYRGESAKTLQKLSSLVSRIDERQIALVDDIFKQNSVPTTDHLLAKARLSFIMQGRMAKMPPVSINEARLILPHFRRQFDEIITLRDESEVMSDRLVYPKDIRDFEHVLRDAHVLSKRLEVADGLGKYLIQLHRRADQHRSSTSGDVPQEVSREEDQALAKNISQSRVDLRQREAELQLARLELASRPLQQPKLTEQKFIAAYTWEKDAEALESFLKSVDGSAPLRERLADSSIKVKISRLADTSRQAAGDLTLKSQLLFEGLRWWYHGRYGMGTEAAGLGKSAAAMVSSAAQMALFLPTEMPKPTKPGDLRYAERQTPTYDRRHHYWWAWEDRRAIRNEQHSFSPTKSITKGKTYTLELETYW